MLFFHCSSYPNGDRLRQAMPEGYWSLSALPGKGLSVGIGLEGSLRFQPGPAKSEPHRAGLDLSLDNDPSLEPLKGNNFHHGLLLFTWQPGLLLCVHV